MKLALIQKDGKYEVNKKWVGKDAGLFLQAIGVSGHENTRLLICDVPKCHPYVMVEQLMPVLPIVRCRTFDECIQCSVEAEQGNRHTSSIFFHQRLQYDKIWKRNRDDHLCEKRGHPEGAWHRRGRAHHHDHRGSHGRGADLCQKLYQAPPLYAGGGRPADHLGR